MRRELDIWSPETWHPMRDLLLAQKEMERMFGFPRGFQREEFMPSGEYEETDTHYIMSFDLPGVSRDQLKVELTNNQLTVSGERKEKKGNSEKHYGRFSRQFTFPIPVDSNKTEAEYCDGVLRVAVTKSESAKPKPIKITEGKTGLVSRIIGKTEEAKTAQSKAA